MSAGNRARRLRRLRRNTRAFRHWQRMARGTFSNLIEPQTREQLLENMQAAYRELKRYVDSVPAFRVDVDWIPAAPALRRYIGPRKP